MKKVITPVVILVAFVAIPMLALNLIEKEYKSKPRGAPINTKTLEELRNEKRITSGESMARVGSKKIAELLPIYEKDNKNLDALAGLVYSYSKLSQGYKLLRKNEKVEEPRAKSLQYLAEYEQAMEEAWPQRHEKISDNHMIHMLVFNSQITKDKSHEMNWYNKNLEYLMEKWNGGQKDHETACWIHLMYSLIYTGTPFENKEEKDFWAHKSSNWYNKVVRTFPLEEGRVKRCNLPHF